jgi:hypothetical protein
VGQTEDPGGTMPGLGQGVSELGFGELVVGGGHLRRAFQRATGLGSAPDELGNRGVLERARRGLGPVQRADYPGELVVRGFGEPVAGAGDMLGQAVQRPAAGSDVEGLPGGERPGRAGRVPRDPARGTGLPGTPAGRRHRPGNPYRSP